MPSRVPLPLSARRDEPPAPPPSDAGYPREPDVRVVRLACLAALLPTPVLAAIGAVQSGSAGVLGAVLGALLTVAFFGTTVFVIRRARRTPVEWLGGLIFGSYLAKVVVALAAVLVVKQLGFVDKWIFGVSVLVGVVAFLVAELVLALRVRQPYIDPSES